MRSSCLQRACAALGLTLAAAGWAQSAGVSDAAAELAGPLSAARGRGCDGRGGPASALKPQPLLSQAAARMAQGVAPLEAIRGSGYRALRMHYVRITGTVSRDAVVRAMAQKYCAPLTDPQLTDVGVHQQPGGFWIVLAAPFDPPPAAAAGEVGARVLALVNEVRARPRQCGDRAFGPAPPLRSNGLLDRAAAAHAQDMARHGYMGHEGRDGSQFSERITRAGYVWRKAGENVAAGQPTAEQVVAEWTRSPAHCANLMNPAFSEMGLAYAVNTRSESGIYWAQAFGQPR